MNKMSATGGQADELVSVTIPVYNGHATVADTLRSVLAQTHRNLEIIVVDDGSTDGTWEVLKSFGDSIRAVRQRNCGLAAARNTGIQAARGDYIALMDADDLCEPERIAVQLRFLQQRRNVLLCCSDFSAFSASGPVASSYSSTYYSRCSPQVGGVQARYPQRSHFDITTCLPAGAENETAVPIYFGNVYDELALGNFVHPPTVMFRRQVLDTVGQFEIEARTMCDWDWLVRVARVGTVGFIDRPLLQYRLSATQMSANPGRVANSLHVALRICERDPSLRERHPAAMRELFGEMYADAADAFAEKDRSQAFSLLATSLLRYGWLTGQTARTLLKIMSPSAVLELLRGMKARNRQAI